VLRKLQVCNEKEKKRKALLSLSSLPASHVHLFLKWLSKKEKKTEAFGLSVIL